MRPQVQLPLPPPKWKILGACLIRTFNQKRLTSILKLEFCSNKLHRYLIGCGARGGANGWGPALQTGRSRVRLFFFLILLADSPSNRDEYQGRLLGSEGGRCFGAGNLATFMYRLLEILAAPTSWSVQTCIGFALPFNWMRLWQRTRSKIWTVSVQYSYTKWTTS